MTLNDKEIEADKWMKKRYPLGYIVAGNYEGYKEAFIEGFKKGEELSK